MGGKYQAYPKHISSGIEWVDQIPSHWVVKKLGSLGRFSASGIDKKVVQGEPKIAIVNYRDVYGNQKNLLHRDKEYMVVTCPQSKKDEHQILKGDLLFTPSSETIEDIGVSCLVDEDIPETSFSYHLIRLNFNEELAHGFKKYFVNNVFTLSQFSQKARGTTRQTLGRDDFKSAKVLLPPYKEQEKIANFLDHETAKIDTLIDKQQQLIKLLKEKRQAVISHAVTKGLNPDAPMKDSGVEWLGEVPEGWSVTKLSYRYEVLLGKMLDDKKITGVYLGKYLRNTDVQWDQINTNDLPEMDFRPEEQERFSVKKGDLIVCEGGEIGRSAIWENDESCFYQKALHRLRPTHPDSDHTRFMFYVLFDAVHQERFVSGAGKATIAHLPAETFRQYRFAYPPLKEQLSIVEYLDGIKTKFDLMEHKALDQIEFLQERRTALISAAVTGKIDIRNWQPGG